MLGVAAVGALAGAVSPRGWGGGSGSAARSIVGSILFPVPMALFPLAHGSHWLSGAMLLAGEFLASVGVMIFDVNQNSLMLMLIPTSAAEPGRRRLAVLQLRDDGRSGRCSAGCSGGAIGLRATLWVSVLGCLLGVLFLLVSPMPRMREEDLAVNVSSDLFRSRSVVALVAAEVISTTGSQMTWIALPWFVLATSGSATRMSVVVAAELIGVGLLALPGGRLSRQARRAPDDDDVRRRARPAHRSSSRCCTGRPACRSPLLLIVAFLLGALAAPYFARRR